MLVTVTFAREHARSAPTVTVPSAMSGARVTQHSESAAAARRDRADELERQFPQSTAPNASRASRSIATRQVRLRPVVTVRRHRRRSSTRAPVAEHIRAPAAVHTRPPRAAIATLAMA